MKRQQVWITEDGTSFQSEAAAKEHELVGILANTLILDLRLKPTTADIVARNYKDILRVIAEVRASLKPKVKNK